ncbi:MAG: glycosyltransferase family 2 protein [Gammaproteobacteria bacterium]
MTEQGISVVIVNYNAGNSLAELVSGLDENTCVDKIIIVDNGSTDASLGPLEENAAHSSKLALIRNPMNRGFATANNQGVAQAGGKYLLFINPDCDGKKIPLARLMQLMDQRPDVGMLGIVLRNADGSEQRGGRRYLPDPQRSLMRVLGINRHGFGSEVRGFDMVGTPLPDRPTEVEAISGAFMLVRREVLQQLGGWDESYFLHCEDLDLCMRFKLAGWKVLFVPDVSVTHYQGTSSRNRPVFVLRHKHRGMWRFYSKFYRGEAFWLLTLAVWSGIWLRFLLLAAAVSARRPFVQLLGHKSI